MIFDFLKELLFEKAPVVYENVVEFTEKKMDEKEKEYRDESRKQPTEKLKIALKRDEFNSLYKSVIEEELERRGEL